MARRLGRVGRCPRCSTALFTLTELPKYSQWAQWRVDGKRMKVPFSKCPKCNFELLSSELPSQGDSRTEKRMELITPDILRMVANLEAEIAALETDQSHGIPTFPLRKATSECTTAYGWSGDIPDSRKLPTLFDGESREETAEEQEEGGYEEDSVAEGEGE